MWISNSHLNKRMEAIGYLILPVSFLSFLCILLQKLFLHKNNIYIILYSTVFFRNIFCLVNRVINNKLYEFSELYFPAVLNFAVQRNSPHFPISTNPGTCAFHKLRISFTIYAANCVWSCCEWRKIKLAIGLVLVMCLRNGKVWKLSPPLTLPFPIKWTK